MTDLEYAISRREYFQNANIFANKINENYYVFSYNVKIYEETENSIFFDTRMFSNTTSKIQNIIFDQIFKRYFEKSLRKIDFSKICELKINDKTVIFKY